LIGPNGAGKTTLFNAVTGALRPNAGAVTFDGTDVTGWRPDRLAAVGLSRTFQIARGLAQLTVIENLMLYGKHQPGESLLRRRAAHGAAAHARGGTAPARDRRSRASSICFMSATIARSISPAGRRSCSSSAARLMAEPKLIMLDEPAAGINPTLAKKLGEHILALKARGITFLIIEHNMGLVAALCDHVVVLVQGRRFIEGRFRRPARRPARAGSLYGASGMTKSAPAFAPTLPPPQAGEGKEESDALRHQRRRRLRRA
jgi:ABC-type branched-subunit amino acid transport system ATPase component